MMDDISVRPYFIRAVYQWCVDENHTPYLLANWSDGNTSAVPKRLINGGRIVFNISPHAVRHLVVNGEGVFFTARFIGKTVEVRVPLADVISVYAREKQSGITFPPLAAAASAAAEKSATSASPAPSAAEKPAREKPRRKATRADIKII